MIEIFPSVIKKRMVILALISFDWKVMASVIEGKYGPYS